MLDINFIKSNAGIVKQGMINKGEKNSEVVDQVIAKDEEWRTFVHNLDTLRSENNAKAKQIGILMGQGKKEEAQLIIKETSQFKNELKTLEEREKELLAERDDLLYRIANVPHPSVPVGHTEDENEVFFTWREPSLEEWRKPHWEIIERYGWVDFERPSFAF